jgi:uncharacterized protein YdiU (UPF0061 family)
MQIHEITRPQLDEGLLDLAKKAAGGVRGAVQGFQQSRQDRQTAQASAAVAKKAIATWDRYARNLKAQTPDPTRYQQLYQQALAAFVQKNLLANQPIDSAINKREITELINAITAAEANPQQVSSLMGKLVQQAALSQQDIGRGVSLAKIVSINPTVIQYRNINYAQNQQGDWANQQTGRVPDESFQIFLDQEATRAGA